MSRYEIILQFHSGPEAKLCKNSFPLTDPRGRQGHSPPPIIFMQFLGKIGQFVVDVLPLENPESATENFTRIQHKPNERPNKSTTRTLNVDIKLNFSQHKTFPSHSEVKQYCMISLIPILPGNMSRATLSSSIQIQTIHCFLSSRKHFFVFLRSVFMSIYSLVLPAINCEIIRSYFSLTYFTRCPWSSQCFLCKIKLDLVLSTSVVYETVT